jgi:K+-sensing histidine kinase KdpD
VFITLTIGVADFYTGYEISFSVFYLLPVSMLALYRNVGKFQLLLNCVFAGTIWFLAEYLSDKVYSHTLIPYWNALVRLLIFVFISYILFILKNKHKEATNYLNKLRNLTNEKNKIIGTIAYDLKTPVNYIKTSTELLMSGKKYENISSYEKDITNQIYVASETALNEIKRLLDVSLIEENKLIIKPVPHDYFAFIEKIQNSFKAQAKKKNIKISISCNNKEKILHFDSELMEDAFENILTYILEIASLGETMHVHVLQQNSTISTSVSVKGKIISPKDLPFLFELASESIDNKTIEQSDDYRTKIGLIIAKKIITAHKGKIFAQSDAIDGTKISFELPI